MKIQAESWVSWIGATVAAAVTGMFVLLTFAYGQFETKDHAKERMETMKEQLTSIDTKIDKLTSVMIQQADRKNRDNQ